MSRTMRNLFSPSWTGLGVNGKRITLAVVNLLLLLPPVIRHFSLTVGIPFLVVTALEVLILLKGNKSRGVCSYFSLLFFVDLLLLAWLFFEPYCIGVTFRMDGISFDNDSTWLIPAVVGVGLYVFVRNFVGDLGLCVSLTMLCYGAWGDSMSLMLAVILFCVLWFLCSRISLRRGAQTRWWSFLSILAAAAILLVAGEELSYYAEDVGAWLRNLPETYFSWFHVVLTVLVLNFVSVVVMEDLIGKRNPDAEIFHGLSLAVLLSKILMCLYFPFSWGMVVLFLLFGYLCLKRQGNKRVLGIKTPFIYMALFLVLLAASVLLYFGKWLLLLVSLLVCVAYANMRSKHNGLPARLVLLVGIAAIAFVYLFTAHESIEAVRMIVSELVITIVCVVCLSVFEAGEVRIKAVMTAFLLLVVLTVLPGGADISVERDGTDAVVVEASPHGKNNRLEEMTFVWSDGLYVIDPEDATRLTGKDIRLEAEVDGKRLYIEVTDKNGVVTKRDIWIPIWIDEID